MSAGSITRKWDLHVHTPASFHHEFKFVNEEEKNTYNNDLWEKYISELEKIKDISVIGITDYFSIEGYKKVVQYKNQGRLKNLQLILPNIEFRLEKVVGGRKLNYHVIFSDEIDGDVIENEFLEALHIKYQTEKRPLKRKNIEEVGRLAKKDQASFKGDSEYIVGCKVIAVSEDEIREILQHKKSVFGEKYLLVLAEEGWCDISWEGQVYLIKRELLAKSHAMFTSNPNTRDWLLGKKDKNPEEIENEFGSLKPCIHGSDAHSFERLCKPDGDRFCWVKADCTFEGLKQIIYEPEARVRIQPVNPENRKSIYTLSSMKLGNSYINAELSIEEGEMQLNKNLVIVTGGKGDGKTAFLELIANCFQNRCTTGEPDSNSFVQRIEDEKPDLQVEIAFAGQNTRKFCKVLVDDEFFNESRITYLPQGKIEEYSGSRQKLDKKIQEIIFGSERVIEGGYKEEFDRLEIQIDDLTETIDELNLGINRLEDETKPEIVKELNQKKGVREGDLTNKETELKHLTQSMQQGLKDRISGIKQEHTKIRLRRSRVDNISNELKAFKDELIQSEQAWNLKIDNLNAELGEVVDLRIPKLDLDGQLKAVDTAVKVISENTKRLSEKLVKLGDELKKLSGVEKTQADVLTDIDNIKADIDSFKSQLQDLLKKKQETTALEGKRCDAYYELLNAYCEWKDYYDQVITAFSTGKSEILHGIDFRSTIHFDKRTFVRLGLDILDRRSINDEEVQQFGDELEAIIRQSTSEISEESLAPFINKLLERKKIVKETRSNYDFYHWILGNYFSLSTRIFFNKTPMEKLSIGQKGTVLLKLFLAEGDYPLIVDQPDENLDNRFIYTELVSAIRDAKEKRQVLLATNNGNLVVNTDAEQIIVAKFENNVISYKSGTLEDLGTRDDIMPILEGGKEAFIKREKKYGI